MITNNGFTVMKNIDISNLTDGEFRLFYAIQQVCFGEKDSYALLQSTMAEKLGVCVRTIQRRLKSLIEKGFISVKRRSHKSSIYTILKGKVENSKQALKELVASASTTQKPNNKSQKYYKKSEKKLKCDNFESRTYDYDDLEKQLLGWDKE